MQVYFVENPVDSSAIISKQRNILASRSEKLIKDIVEIRSSSKDDRNKLFKRMVVDIIINNGLGNPGNHKVYNIIIHKFPCENYTKAFDQSMV